MKYLSMIWSDSRGSVGGTTYSKNRAGLYTRNRTSPSQPRTPAQLAARAAMTACVAAWGNSLTQSQRNGWILYGQTNPITNALGNSVILNGAQMFNRVNIPLFRAAGYAAMEFDAPGAVPLLPAFTIDGTTSVDHGTDFGGTGEVTYTIDFTVDIESTDYIFFFLTAPNGPGRTPVHQPQQMVYGGLVATLGTPAPVMTFTLDDPFPTSRQAGTGWYTRGYWIRANNLSADAMLQGVTV